MDNSRKCSATDQSQLDHNSDDTDTTELPISSQDFFNDINISVRTEIACLVVSTLPGLLLSQIKVIPLKANGTERVDNYVLITITAPTPKKQTKQKLQMVGKPSSWKTLKTG